MATSKKYGKRNEAKGFGTAPGQRKKALGLRSAKSLTPGATKGKALGVSRATAGPTGYKPRAPITTPVAPREPNVLESIGGFISERINAATGKTSSPISRTMAGAPAARAALSRARGR